jgi:hypothetical protein
VLGYTHFHYHFNVVFAPLFLYFIALQNSFFKQITVLEQAMTIDLMTHNIMTLCLVVKLQHSALRLYCAGLYSFSLSFKCFILTFISVFYFF